MSDSPVAIGSLSRKDTLLSIFIIGGLFFIFGFVSWVNAILIPYFKISFGLTNFQSYLVTFSFYISYLVFSVPSSYLLKKWGFKKGMMAGFWAMSCGAFVFVLAAYTRRYGIFLAGLFGIGSGLAILQTAANPYITVLGPRERAAQRISIMGICNKGAGILAPILFAAAILRPGDASFFRQLESMAPQEKLLAQAGILARVMVPYALVGLTLFLLGLLVRYSPLPEIDTEKETDARDAAYAGKTSIFQFPHLVLGAIAIFLHVGTQVIAIDTVIGYANSLHTDLMDAKSFPSFTLGLTILGYCLGILLIPRWITQLTALRICTVLGFLLTIMILVSHGPMSLFGHTADRSVWFVVSLGFANSLVWAGLWPLALDGLGRFTKLGASVMIMGLCGNALVPLAYGWLADHLTTRQAYGILFPCYLYLVYYASHGYKLRSWTRKIARQHAG